VFAAIAYAAVDNELAAPKTELTRKLLELLLQGCIMELKESGKLIHPVLNVFFFSCCDVIHLQILIFSNEIKTHPLH